MELTTALSFFGITAATAVAFYYIHKPVREARAFLKLYDRLNWRQR
jgi:hypothetical protein